MSPQPWIFIQIIAVIGLIISILSALETKVSRIASICAYFGQGCRMTADFTLFRIPVSWWGGVFYILLIGMSWVARPTVFWLVMAGLGFELTFIYILVALRTFCIFCFLNAFVIAILAIAVFDPTRIWQAAVTTFFFFLASYFLLLRENRSRISPDAAANAKVPNIIAPERAESPKIEEAGSPAVGPEDARIHIIEFSDYQCPACRKSKPIVTKIKEEYAQYVRWVYKNFPLPQHEHAEVMALAAFCAQEQDKFGDYHDRLSSTEQIPDRDELVEIADQLGMDRASFLNCLENRRYRNRLEQEKAAAKQAGVTVTPTFIINGQFLTGTPDGEEFRRLIEKELEK